MWLTVPLIGALALPLAAPKIGVIAVGEDGYRAGEMQVVLEHRLRGLQGIDVVGTPSLLRLSENKVPTAPAVDATLLTRLGNLSREAEEAFYRDDAEAALERLDTFDEVALKGRAPGAIRARALLLRVAVLVTQDKKEDAKWAGLAALTADPGLTVDTRKFRPDVKALVDDVRENTLEDVEVSLSGLPPAAKIWVNGRAAKKTSFRIPVGEHEIAVGAPGFRTVSRAIRFTTNSTIRIHLPVALRGSLAAHLESVVWNGTSEDTVMEQLASQLSLDWIVVSAVRSDPKNSMRGYVWSRTKGEGRLSGFRSASARGATALVNWAARAVQTGVSSERSATITDDYKNWIIQDEFDSWTVEHDAPISAATPKPTPKPSPGPRPAKAAHATATKLPVENSVKMSAAGGFQAVYRDIYYEDNLASDGGFGPAAALTFEARRLVLNADVRWLFFRSPLSAEGANYNVLTRLSMSYNVASEGGLFSVRPVGGIELDRHRDTSLAAGLVPNYTRLAFQFSVVAGLHLRQTNTGFFAELGTGPLNLWWNDGDIQSVYYIRSGLNRIFRLGIAHQLDKGWSVDGRYTYDYQELSELSASGSIAQSSSHGFFFNVRHDW